MKCPKCGKELEIQWEEKPISTSGGVSINVVGHCWKCDYDGTWDIITTLSGETVEVNFRQFFFG